MNFRKLSELDATEGTVQLVNADLQQEHLGRTNIVLVPQPSSDPNDPLRWPTWKKNVAFGTICLFTFLNNFAADGPSAGFQNIAIYFDITINKTSGLLSWCVLTLGLSNFLWVPTAIYFGKRPTFLVACLILFIACIWGASSKSFSSLLASTIVGALGGGATEALGAAIINDIFYLHERGTKMGYYIIAISWGSSVGPLVGGFLIENVGWQWQKWLSAILVGINLAMVFFFVPETRFHRRANNGDILDSVTSSEEALPSKDINKVEISSETSTSSSRRSYLQELNPWPGIDIGASYFNLLIRPFPLIAYPACAFAVLAYSISLAPTVMVNIVSSPILESPPYLFNAGLVGLLNIPGMIGQLVGAISGGVLTDKWVTRQARRNNGIFKPESRLILLLFPSIIVTTGLLLFGFAVQRQMSWEVIYVAYGFISVGLTGIASISMTYVMDSHFPVAPECLEMVNGLKNIVAFGFIYATIPWTEGQGYEKAFGELAGVFIFILCLAIPLGIFGSRIRHISSEWRVISW